MLKKSAKVFSESFLKVLFLEQKGDPRMAWSLPKAFISLAVSRNKIKRWGRDSFKKTGLEAWIFVMALKRDKKFYKDLKRKEFDHVFEKIIKKTQQKRPKAL